MNGGNTMNMDEINEFKIEKVEQQAKNLEASEMNELIDYVYCGLEVGMAVACLNPLFLAMALGYLITARMENHYGKKIEEDLKDIKEIKNEDQFEEYKVERIETCEEELDHTKTSQIAYGIVSALALGGMFLAPAVCLVPLYVSVYGFLTAKSREYTAKNDLKELYGSAYEGDQEEIDCKPKKDQRPKRYVKTPHTDLAMDV